MRRKHTGSTIVAMAMFLVSGVLVSVLGIRQAESYTTQEAWGMRGDWPAGVLVKPEMLRKIRVDAEVPYMSDLHQLLGKLLVKDKRDGDALLQTELTVPPRSWLAQQVPESKVLYTLTPHRSAIPHTQMRNGDSFDVVVTGRKGVRTVASNAQLIGVLSEGRQAPVNKANLGSLVLPNRDNIKPMSKKHLVIAVAPEEVYPLASIDSKDKVSIVLHRAGISDGGVRASIRPEPRQRYVELVSGVNRREVVVDL